MELRSGDAGANARFEVEPDREKRMALAKEMQLRVLDQAPQMFWGSSLRRRLIGRISWGWLIRGCRCSGMLGGRGSDFLSAAVHVRSHDSRRVET